MSGAPSEPASDEVLARAAQEGSRPAFGVLVERYSDRLYRFLARKTGNVHDAEDLAQETLLAAFRQIRRFDPARSFRAWVFTIAHRLAISRHRRARPMEALDDGNEPVDERTPAAQVAGADEAAQVWDMAKRELTPNQFAALWLHYGEGLAIREIAQVMGATQMNVKIHLYRSRRRLAGVLAERTPAPGGRMSV